MNRKSENIEYQFTRVPTKLMILLDANCRSMLFTLCQLSSHFADNEGFFFRSNEDLRTESRLSDKLVIATIDTLYINGIVDVKSVGKSKGKHPNYYKINIERIKQYEALTMEDLKNPDNQITMVDYRRKGYSPSYLYNNKAEASSSQDSSIGNPEEIPRKSQNPNNINSIDNIESIYNKDNINNEEYIIEYNKRISEMFDKGYSIPYIASELAKSDWNCYRHFRNKIKSEDKETFRSYADMFNRLNLNFNPN